MPDRPRLGIAFGGGAIRGMAHLGLIELLDKHGVRADMVAGTSIGACIASFYACGYRGSFLISLMQNLNLKQILSLAPSLSGLTDGANYAEFVRLMTKSRNIEDLPIPLRIVATDLEAGEMEVFEEGSIWRAVHASSAVPGIFSPVEYQGRLFVDGCLVDNCPCRVLRDMGADVVIGIDLDAIKTDGRVSLNRQNLINVLQRSLDVMGRKNNSAQDADILLRPMDTYIYSMDLSKAEYALECGRREAAEKEEEILALLRRQNIL